MDTVTHKTLLYKSGVEYADFCLNHVVGCSHGCKYPCYAFLLKKRCGVVKTYEEWCTPKLVSNALELLDYEIPKYKKMIHHVHLCFSTDPFMHRQEVVCNLSLKIIAKLNSHGIRCTVLTKGILPERIGHEKGLSKNNEYGITVVSLREAFREEYEPNTARYGERIEALKFLHRKGLRTWASIEPYPPPNIIEQDLDEILDRLSFVNRIVFGRLNYNSRVSEFKRHREYYNSLARKVIVFCQKRGIAHHIKDGTQVQANGKDRFKASTIVRELTSRKPHEFKVS